MALRSKDEEILQDCVYSNFWYLDFNNLKMKNKESNLVTFVQCVTIQSQVGIYILKRHMEAFLQDMFGFNFMVSFKTTVLPVILVRDLNIHIRSLTDTRLFQLKSTKYKRAVLILNDTWAGNGTRLAIFIKQLIKTNQESNTSQDVEVAQDLEKSIIGLENTNTFEKDLSFLIFECLDILHHHHLIF
ncbi:hypothetical protein BpHYR1_052597 [Brachionus plicatilis]|uniref:Uncharacterized protein n=1 Tax=Brachionus plicatilis TaxID=10195 RepID=A0A3M7Q3S3_BRAPC|nr:hypothetical protein BpHYR1_052597 [Brachionus plicatilis]